MVIDHVQHHTAPGRVRGIYKPRHGRRAAIVAVYPEIECRIVPPGLRAAELGHRQQLENSYWQCP